MKADRAVLLGIGALALIGLAAALWLGIWLGPFFATPGRVAHQYYIPARSMLPTLRVQDRLFPLAVDPAALRRGDVVIFQVRGEGRVNRIIGLPGDMVAVDAQGVTLNGKRIAAPPDRCALGECGGGR